jgi:hypothetical protein
MELKEHALAVFRKTPERLNCAQSVVYAWQQLSVRTGLSVASVKAAGGGHAPQGICGALYAACLAAPERTDSLKTDFAVRMGSLFCKELRTADEHACRTCVATATELLSAAISQSAAPLPGKQHAGHVPL